MKYIDAEELIAEIDRQKIGYNTDGEHAAEYNTCRKILDIITSLQQEQQEVDSEKPVPNDLEEAAKEHFKQEWNENYWAFEGDVINTFIAGAEWQAKQLLKGSPMFEDTVLFNKGVEEGKRLMMKEAVEADVMLTLHDKTGDISLHTGYLPKELGIKCDDKVRIIIVKEY